jgi:hypothetical protein
MSAPIRFIPDRGAFACSIPPFLQTPLASHSGVIRPPLAVCPYPRQIGRQRRYSSRWRPFLPMAFQRRRASVATATMLGPGERTIVAVSKIPLVPRADRFTTSPAHGPATGDQRPRTLALGDVSRAIAACRTTASARFIGPCVLVTAVARRRR